MSNNLNHFVTIRQTRSDILAPATFRSMVELIQGVIDKYDYDGLDESYQSFLAHLANHDDPHKVTDSSFFGQIIDRIYAIYLKMTTTPLNRTRFDAEIVPSIALLELIRRIVLNRFLYNQVKNPDGSVNAQVTARLGKDWGRLMIPNVKVDLTFPRASVNEDAFIALGYGTNSTPISTVFNANSLTQEAVSYATAFHTSQASPYLNAGGSQTGYIFSLYGASNDFTVEGLVQGLPLIDTTVVSLLNGTDTLSLKYSPTGTVSLVRGSLVIASNLPCNDGQFILDMTKAGICTLIVTHNARQTTTTYTLATPLTSPLLSGMLNVPIVSVFSDAFGTRSLTVKSKSNISIPDPAVLPIVLALPDNPLTPITGTVSTQTATIALTALAGYYIYLTLTGTWTGSVQLQRSTNNGASWQDLTTQGEPFARFTQNCDEEVLMVEDYNVRYRLLCAITTGTVVYRLAQ